MNHLSHRNEPIWNFLIAAGILGAASALCFLLQQVVSTDYHVPLIFVLAVLCVSRFTRGYVYGIVAAIFAVFGVNYVFTYPYFRLNFTLTGYPLTFLVMFTVSVIVSALTTQIKNQEEIRLEIEKEQLRGNLLRSVSHDLRTPLTSIVGSASLLLENEAQLKPEERHELLSDIQREALWLNQVMENILSVTRITGEPAGIHREPELAEEVAGSAVGKFRKRNPGVRVRVVVPDDPLLIPMDPILIEQVLTNLLDNALTHGKNPEGITLSVTADEKQARFAVMDHGEGIDPSMLPHLFDGTLPLQKKETESRSNMRIGLSVCMSIVRAHEGMMSARNLPEGGAEVSFTLPLQEGNHA